ncbi:MAG TPA: hypothetical protein VF668_21875 [Pyrinomonadaceae bacterium]|jgi:hypothetical protein
MSAVMAVTAAKFLRRTTLLETEANTNFRMLDDDVAEAITSPEADRVTPLMSKVYTRLLLTPPEWREGERVLRFTGQEQEGKWVTAWEQLRRHLRVSSETASKALRWMHGQGVIGYYSGKNGVGIRIFLNRAAASVKRKREAGREKILPFGLASDGRPRTSPNGTPLNDSYAVSEVLDTDLSTRAPKNGAGAPTPFEASPGQTSRQQMKSSADGLRRETPFARTASHAEAPVEQIVSRLRSELEPALQRLARQAAAGEHERTREWLESKGLPKAARVAQRETYDVLRRHGLLGQSRRTSGAEVGRAESAQVSPRALSESEACELAEACMALFEVKGQTIETTLSEMNVASGGFLLPEDASRVLEKFETLMSNGRRPGRGGEFE